MKWLYLSGALILITLVNGQERKFPDGFKFGVSTAAYQVEGAWNISGKGESIWDYLTHNSPEEIMDRNNGDDACNSYYNYKRDVEMIKSLGVDFYRFSISWTRILPKGLGNQVNKDGIKYYNSLIDELLANGIEPVVTLYHWDLPQPLQVIGGWTNSIIADYFVDYARIVFDNFADRVKTWVTFNEPYNVCGLGYGLGYFNAPLMKLGGFADYLCSKTLILAHARTYRMFQKEYAYKYPGRFGMSNAYMWAEPATDEIKDIEAADMVRNVLAWFIDPIYFGDYPEKLKEVVAENSKKEGYFRSRLPQFTKSERKLITGTADFIGINHYSTDLISSSHTDDKWQFLADIQFHSFKNPKWKRSKASPWLSVYPNGFRSLLNWLKRRYNNPDMLILESGYATLPHDSRDDDDRIEYYRSYLDILLDAILIDRCNVTAYAAWSLMDNFEWIFGYTSRFGLFEVDFDSPDKTLTERKSAKVYREIVRTRMIDYNFNQSAYD